MSYRYRLEVNPDCYLSAVMDQMEDISNPEISWFYLNGDLVGKYDTIHWETTDPIPHWGFHDLALLASDAVPNAAIAIYEWCEESGTQKSIYRGGHLIEREESEGGLW